MPANEGANAQRRRRATLPLRIAIGIASLILATGFIATALVTASIAQGADTAAGPSTFRRLTEDQYKRSIEAIFGSGITVPGRFEPRVRAQGLLAIGDSQVAVSSSGFEQYELRAREIAAQVLAPERRASTVGCTPHTASTFDDACATAFFTKYGTALYRGPISAPELSATLTLARAVTRSTNDFYKGLEVGLSRLIASPYFVFRVEHSEPDPTTPGAWRLTNYSLASRISFLLWDAPPDTELMNAASRGALYDRGELQRQVDRLIASPHFVDGTRAFFSDMLGYDQFDHLTKDQSLYPQYTSQLAADAREQTLRTIVYLLVTKNGDYRDLFTTRTTFLNRRLAGLYRVRLPAEGFEGWVPYDFPKDQARAGIMTQAAFLMLDATHESRSSPTIRGKTVRELLLCQRIPEPPPNVDFSIVQKTDDQVHKTVRERLDVHRSNPVCAGCHKLMDPIGLSMENYDAIGGYRTLENGAVIDASGTFDDKPYRDAIGLEGLIHDSQAATNCVVRRAYEYGLGGPLVASENASFDTAGKGFAADHYSFPSLMRRIATSSAFSEVSNTNVASK